MKGRLIVIEGLDGSGKATQSKLLSDSLSGMGRSSKLISFPDYSQPSSSLVKMYLNSEFGNSPSDVNAFAASSFFAVDRYASYMKFWRDFYQNGNTIICDRYVTSNAIYQMAKMDESYWKDYLQWLYDYEYNKLALPKPDLVIYLFVPVGLSQTLMDSRYDGDITKKDLHEKNILFLQNCQKAADYVRKLDNWNVVECSRDLKMRSVHDIHNDIIQILKNSGLGY